jgi:hypothetical protein
MEKRENEKVEVSCKVSNAKPAAEVAWFRNNVPFNPGKGILHHKIIKRKNGKQR